MLARGTMMMRKRTQTQRLSRPQRVSTHSTTRDDATAPLPLNRSFLRRVDVLAHSALEEKRRHVVREERAGLWIHHIETVMVDQHRLLLQPFAPTLLTDLLHHACADLAGKWRAFEATARLSAARASHI